MKKVVLYTRKQCPLCDDARTLLQMLEVEIEERDIESNDEWHRDYAMMIPVIAVDGEELYGVDIEYGNLIERLGLGSEEG